MYNGNKETIHKNFTAIKKTKPQRAGALFMALVNTLSVWNYVHTII